MASIRRLKKDIDYLTFSVIADCFNYSMIAGDKNAQVSTIVKNIIESRNSLRDRVSGGKHLESKKEKKEYYKTIFKDLMISADQAFTQLSEVVKQG